MSDAAGNDGAVATQAYTLDTVAPSPAPTVTALATKSQTPVLNGTATLGAGESLKVIVDYGNANVTYTNVPVSAGAWSLNLATATPASGTLALGPNNTYEIRAEVTDTAGNIVVDSTSGELVIDNTAPTTAPTIVPLTTNNNQPTITGTLDAAAYANGAGRFVLSFGSTVEAGVTPTAVPLTNKKGASLLSG